MKNIFDLVAREKEVKEREMRLAIDNTVYNARWAAKELEKKNEIAEAESLNSRATQAIEASHKKEISDLKIKHAEELSRQSVMHLENLAELKEDIKSELGAKAIDLEKELAEMTEKKENERMQKELIDRIVFDLREENAKLLTTVLEFAKTAQTVKVVEPQVVSPQIVEGKINVISTCGK